MSKLSNKRDQIIDLKDVLRNADTNGDNEIEFEEWRIHLKKYVQFKNFAYITLNCWFLAAKINSTGVEKHYSRNKLYRDLSSPIKRSLGLRERVYNFDMICIIIINLSKTH